MTNFLNLDEVKPTIEFSFQLNGKRHELVPATVETFIANMNDLKSLGVNADPIDELQVMLKMIGRAFPTITEKELKKLTLDQAKAISEYARRANGEVVETTTDTGAEGDAEGNAPAAN